MPFRRALAVFAAALFLLAAPALQARKPAEGVARDKHGRIQRSPHAVRAFRKATPCPSTGRRSGACPGYEVDHVTPLACGGADVPGNMQWLTKAENRRKSARCAVRQ